ncbi:MAG: tetratricopeptide repeat protein [Chitinophagales bacterium]|nr:tetratricopeptide repeat protein [Chitinophagales bacterium]MCO5280161.1 tetratricopeptide repeat protein [Chitinophagales bacterium]OJV25475.1 MAG: hypothetical protein BGO32_00175 [Bacteroidetes bacterium 37-13]HRN94463.1 tetratricopeptide repeat protein [Chitinophagales bacterium]HRP38057.1 tetratricopeptide repeat protein [Chitinophagales bacterium]
MNIKQIILVSVAVVALIGFFLFGKTKSTKKNVEAKAPASQEEVFDIQQYLKLAKQNLKSKDTLTLIENAENAFKVASESTAKQAAAENLAALLVSAGDPLSSAYYYNEAAKLGNSAALWHGSGENFLALAHSISAPTTQSYLFDAAINAFQKAADAEPNNLNHKVKLGAAYVEQGTNPMQGVTMLLDVAKQDSTNIDAQFTLGKFSMVSGQFEKAINRLEKVLHSQPQNSEALFLIAEAYRNMGNISKAVEYFEKCKQQIDNEAIRIEIDRYIEETKNIK